MLAMIFASAFLMPKIQPPLIHEVRTKNGSKVVLKMLVEKEENGSVPHLVLRVINKGAVAVTLPTFVTPDYFLQVEGVPFKSGDIISEAPRFPDYGYRVVNPGASLRHEVEIEEILDNRRDTDGDYSLQMTYDDSWSKFPALGRIHIGRLLITKKGRQVTAELIHSIPNSREN